MVAGNCIIVLGSGEAFCRRHVPLLQFELRRRADEKGVRPRHIPASRCLLLPADGVEHIGGLRPRRDRSVFLSDGTPAGAVGIAQADAKAAPALAPSRGQDGMKTKFYLTVDTEHSMGGAWADPSLKPVP